MASCTTGLKFAKERVIRAFKRGVTNSFWPKDFKVTSPHSHAKKVGVYWLPHTVI